MRHWPKHLVLAMLQLYQWTLSPAFAFIGVRCRHEPSCSHYAAAAVRRHGAWVGAWMALARVQRCRPGGSAGYDPAPEAIAPGAWRAPWRVADWRGPQGCDHKHDGRRASGGDKVEPDQHA